MYVYMRTLLRLGTYKFIPTRTSGFGIIKINSEAKSQNIPQVGIASGQSGLDMKVHTNLMEKMS